MIYVRYIFVCTAVLYNFILIGSVLYYFVFRELLHFCTYGCGCYINIFGFLCTVTVYNSTLDG